jgi:hypothetical protein
MFIHVIFDFYVDQIYFKTYQIMIYIFKDEIVES